ncbi:hypothetical protein TeGR_g3917, partial [Tetraparma gracilis]
SLPGCVACAYKLLLPDLSLDSPFTSSFPNVRPENCPRATSAGEPPALYGRGVLCVGDGDLSFARALLPPAGSSGKRVRAAGEGGAPHRGPGVVVATSLETRETLEGVYGAEAIGGAVGELGEGGVGFEVDVTRLRETLGRALPDLDLAAVDTVCWNFPCTAEGGGQDGQNQQMEANKALLRSMVANVRELGGRKGIVLTHKTKPPFDQWSIVDVVEGEREGAGGYKCRARVAFDRCCYGGYVNRKALDRKSFTAHDAEVYCFEWEAGEGEGQGAGAGEGWGEERGLVRVTEDVLSGVRSNFMNAVV